MKIYLQMDGDKLVEYIEKAEYDLLRFAPNYLQSELRAANAILADTQAELNAAVRRMNDIPAEAIEDAYRSSWESYQNIRNLFIQAAKGEQP
jgi:hypothetical protein